MRVLAVDYGKARTGLAVCDAAGILASPAGVIEERSQERLVEKIAGRAAELRAERLVVGLPRNMDGTEGESAQAAGGLAAALEAACGLPVELWDERGTTLLAHRFLNETNTRGKKRKAVVDAVAAVIILESYLQKCAAQKRGETAGTKETGE